MFAFYLKLKPLGKKLVKQNFDLANLLFDLKRPK